jgi:FlaA1/EpsC-like NDP-sugar epimerase
MPTESSLAKKILRARLGYGRRFRPVLVRREVQYLLDAICASAAVIASYLLRFDFSVPPWARAQMWAWAGLLFFVDPILLGTFGGYRSTWQYFGSRDFVRMAKRVVLFNAALIIVPLLTPKGHWIPYGIIILDFILFLLFTGSVRMLRRLDHEALLRLSASERILIVGHASELASAIRQLQPLYGAGIAGAITNDATLVGMTILGVPVVGVATDLGPVMHAQRVTLLFLCSGDLDQIPQVMQVASDFDVPVKFLPSVHDLLDNRVRVSKNVTVDALSHARSETLTLPSAVIDCLEDRVVLVTGAGGSIGSELVRQVATTPVRKLILLDQDENSIFELLGELGSPDIAMPVIADIRDAESMERLFAAERPHVVLHAAAYKHVPMMEANACEAVLNNVSGTRTLVETAVRSGTERFVMISSDKAVRPSSIMGATKRAAELIVQRCATEFPTESHGESGTSFACVRFGNVLGSRGSVLPLFLRQIAQGGPITITHEEMTRYFMTIPQAVNLVLQAATLASCGHIYMLDMGDPVRIVNFAREVIQLSGLQPDKDIEIKIVGARPGEKLHEQLWSEDAHVTPTEFSQIFRVQAEEPGAAFPALLAQMEQAARERNSGEVRRLMSELPLDYLSAEASRPEPALVG